MKGNLTTIAFMNLLQEEEDNITNNTMAETPEQRRRSARPRYQIRRSNSGVTTITPSNAAARRDSRSNVERVR